MNQYLVLAIAALIFTYLGIKIGIRMGVTNSMGFLKFAGVINKERLDQISKDADEFDRLKNDYVAELKEKRK